MNLNNKIFHAFLIIICNLFPFGIWATDLYVSTSGSDSSIGTQAAPFKTILKASESATPGSIIHVAAGIYIGGFQTTASGIASARITYISDKKWGARIVPPKNSTSDIGWDNRGAFVTIENFEVDGTVNPTSGPLWSVGINVAGTGNRIVGCQAHHIYNSAIANSNGGAGLLLDSWYGFNDMQALNNVVHHVGPASGGEGWYHGIYQTATGMIKNNIVYANSGGGIHLWHDANHIDIVNNTSFGNGYGIIVGGGDYVNTSGPADYINVTNNIVYDNKVGINQEGDNGSHNTYTNNLVYQNVSNWINDFTTGSATHSADVVAAPQFVNYIRTGGGDYHLKNTSPAIDRGAKVYAPLMDLDGVARPQGAAVDIGVYEYVALTPAKAPIISLSTKRLEFGSQLIGSNSAIQLVTITNKGPVDLVFSSAFSMAGDFYFGSSGSGSCALSASYAPGASCTVSVIFKPTASGVRSGVLSVSSNASSVALTVALSGAGVAADGTTPETAITAPVNHSSVARSSASFKSRITIQAMASDNIAITVVEFYVNDSLVCTTIAAPYQCVWKVPKNRRKNYILQTKARDAAGNVSSSSLVVITSK